MHPTIKVVEEFLLAKGMSSKEFHIFWKGYDSGMEDIKHRSFATVSAKTEPIDAGCFEQAEANNDPTVMITVSELGRLRTVEIKYNENENEIKRLTEIAESLNKENSNLTQAICILKREVQNHKSINATLNNLFESQKESLAGHQYELERLRVKMKNISEVVNK